MSLKASGSGFIDYRLVIEGWPHVWTTSPRITYATNKDGRMVYPGLSMRGLKIGERVVLREAWPQIDGIAFRIVPTGNSEETLMAFTREAQTMGYLAANAGVPGMTEDSVSYELDNELQLPAGYYHVGSECFHTDGDTDIIQRPKWDTLAQKHFITYGPTRAISVPVYDWPPTMEGRRVFLYAYGQGDDGAGDGEVWWRGVVARPPKLDKDGVSWTIQTESIIKVLDQQLAAAEEIEYKLRGIYHHHNCPFALRSMFFDKGPNYNLDQQEHKIVGFFETEDDFVATVNAALAEVLAARGDAEITALWFDMYRGRPKIWFTPVVGTLSSDFAVFQDIVLSVLEGDLIVNTSRRSSGEPIQGKVGDVMSDTILGSYVEEFGNDSGDILFSELDDDHKPPYTYPLPPARGMVGFPPMQPTSWEIDEGYTYPLSYSDDVEYSSHPSNRIYLTSVTGLAVGQFLVARNENIAAPLEILAIDLTDRYIDVHPWQDQALYFDSSTVFVPLRVMATDSDLGAFAAGLTAAAIHANDGDTPYITDGDIDAASLTQGFLQTPIPDYWRHRNYVFLRPIPVKTVLQEELKAIGFMARLTADGRVGFTNLPVLSATARPVATITDADILLPASGLVGNWVAWEFQPDGIVNTINGRFGYRPSTDEFDPKYDFTVRDIASISEHKSSGKGSIEIAPRSIPAGLDPLADTGSSVAAIDVADWTRALLSVLSRDYAVVTISVPFKFFHALVGDTVSVTCRMIPNGLGGRGVTGRRAAVVGRSWNLDPANQGEMGTLTLYFPRDVTGGYTPTGRVTATAGDGAGGPWTLSFDSSDVRNIAWSDNGDGDVVRHFAVGDKVQLKLQNSDLGTNRQGTIVAVDYTELTIDVELVEAWTPGANVWNLMYAVDAGGGSVTTAQRQAVFVADALRVLTVGGYARKYV